ncbi:MAG: 50S ribosomal protein L13 [Rickettsia sp.]|nr:50S ribosomal protein L13 [Rickettsia sp.]
MGIVKNKSYSIKELDIKKRWFLIDAKNLVLGRLSSEIAKLIRGKHKTNFTPHMDCGDKIIVTNSKYIHLSGKKLQRNGKMYYRHTGFPGGLKTSCARDIKNSKYPEKILELAIKNMMPSNSLSRNQLKKNLFLYPEDIHPHLAQSPVIYDFETKNPKNTKR